MVGVVGVERAFGKRDRLAGEAADLLETANAARNLADDHTLHFVRCRAVANEIGDD